MICSELFWNWDCFLEKITTPELVSRKFVHQTSASSNLDPYPPGTAQIRQTDFLITCSYPPGYARHWGRMWMTKMLNMYEDAMVGSNGKYYKYIYIYITCIACIHFYTIAFDSSKNLGHNIDISGFTILLAQRTVNPYLLVPSCWGWSLDNFSKHEESMEKCQSEPGHQNQSGSGSYVTLLKCDKDIWKDAWKLKRDSWMYPTNVPLREIPT